jgi:beta-lactamase regulating signal transducer with metallopeptidase domain
VTAFLHWTIVATVLLSVALLGVRIFRRRSASTRHRILSTALLCTALAPIASLILPAWNVIPAASQPPIAVSQPLGLEGGVAPSHARAANSGSVDPWPWLVFLWLAGALTAFAILIVGWVRLARVSIRSKPVIEGLWLQTATTIARQLRVRNVRLLKTRNLAILATWGVVRPAVLIPAHSETWPEERICAALHHELAHIRRLDWLFQTLAELLRAILWFNPLLWMVCSRMRIESEFACDDAVLAQGISGSRYAGHLLDIVRTVQTDRAWSAAMAISRPSTLERRFSAMVNSSLDRRPANRLFLSFTVIVALSVTLPLAAVSRSAPVQSSPVLVAAGGSPAPKPAITPPPASAAKSRPTAAQQPAPAPSPFKGEPITLDLMNVDVNTFFQTIGTVGGVNVVLDPDVTGQITVTLKDIPWDQALDIVLKNTKLRGSLDGNVLRISKSQSVTTRIALDFEVYRNGTLLDRPRIATASGTAANLTHSDADGKEAFHISVTPTQAGEERISINLEFGVGSESFRANSLLVSPQAPGRVTWMVQGDTFEIRVTSVSK